MIGKILKNMRKHKKLKQSELAKIVNIPQNTLSQYETGKIQPTFQIIEKIANACDFDINFVNKEIIFNSKNIDRLDV